MHDHIGKEYTRKTWSKINLKIKTKNITYLHELF